MGCRRFDGSPNTGGPFSVPLWWGGGVGLSVAVRKSPEALLAAAAANPPAGVIVDLNTPGLEVEALISRLSAIGPVRVIGFGSHVDKETLDAAKAAGCNEVMPRSKFVKELEANLLGWFS